MPRNPITQLPAGEEERPWYRRLTIVAGAGFAAVQFLEAQGVVPQGLGQALDTAAEQVVALVETGLGLGALVGLYRQAAKPRGA